ncbi:hypothetical protein [Rhodobacter sp. NSM]|uniref:hypothetical protein n=1 Tax=Rhodobacter sp. NSM TaxID=3457501 RepID=UPI003FD49818
MLPSRMIFARLGLALLLAAPQLAEASNDTTRNQAPARGVVQTRSAGTFDWLAKPVVTRAAFESDAVRVRRQIGRGSWICSPAGFGRGSRCYAN